jgi:hypothetical protein
MGLLDPAMFTAQGNAGLGGLLQNILRTAQINPVQSPGFDQTQDMSARSQPPLSPQNPFAARAQFVPGLPAQQPMPQQTQPQTNSVMGDIGNTLGSVFSLIAPRHAAVFQQQQQLQNARQFLTGKGYDAGTASVVAGNPALFAQVAGNQLGIKDKTDDIREYEFAKTQGYKGSLLDWMSAKRAGAGEYGLNPVYGTGPDGKPVVLQLGKSGTAVASKIPDGVTISTGIEKVDLGTQWGILDKRSGQIIGYQPKDLKGAARDTAIGKTEGGAAPGVFAAETTVNNALDTINKLRSHPGLDMATGATGIIARKIPGTEAYNFDALNKQAAGQTFMAAREALKGAGQVTDFEGNKGEQAVANLDAAQTKEQYLKALDTLEKMMKASVADLKRKAGMDPNAQVHEAPSPAPSVGGTPSIDDLVKKYSK